MPLLGAFKTNILNPIIGFMFAVALLYFLYGMYEFVAGGDNEDRLTKAKNYILYGIIGLFIMVSAFGILNLICNTIRAC